MFNKKVVEPVESEVIGTCADCNKNHLPVYATLGKFVCNECFQSEFNQEERLKVHKANQSIARIADGNITTRTDLFNAATMSIVQLKDSIQADTTILNKPYALAEQLLERFTHFKGVIFEMNEKIIEAGNQQKAIQVYLNQLANTLRAEEREKLRIADISYKPSVVKPAKVSPIKTAKNKLDKVELKKYALELGIPEFTLQMLVVSKGMTVEQVANMLRKNIAEAKLKDTKKDSE